MTLTDKLRSDDAVIAIDIQNDFCPGGALAVEQGDSVIPIINRWLDAADRAGALAIATRDWHTVEHCSFQAQGGPWPEHCVQSTLGAAFHSALKLPAEAVLVSKGAAFDKDAYSAFDGTGLEVFLNRKAIHRLWIGGLALDVCVLATVRDARHHGFETHVLVDACRPVAADKVEQVLAEMRAAGAILESGS